jgi:hypothetical protein
MASQSCMNSPNTGRGVYPLTSSAVCRAMKVLCVAEDDDRLAALKRACVSVEWELATGATDERSAMDQIDVERPHVMVVFGSFDRLVELTRERFPGMRIITDRETQGATAVADGPEAVRDLIKGMPRPAGPAG